LTIDVVLNLPFEADNFFWSRDGDFERSKKMEMRDYSGTKLAPPAITGIQFSPDCCAKTGGRVLIPVLLTSVRPRFLILTSPRGQRTFDVSRLRRTALGRFARAVETSIIMSCRRRSIIARDPSSPPPPGPYCQLSLLLSSNRICRRRDM
jgi:hypothetical protein